MRQMECDYENGHCYAEVICQACGNVFCYNCCADQNVDQGGKYEEDYMICSNCDYDICEDIQS